MAGFEAPKAGWYEAPADTQKDGVFCFGLHQLALENPVCGCNRVLRNRGVAWLLARVAIPQGLTTLAHAPEPALHPAADQLQDGGGEAVTVVANRLPLRI